MEKHPSPLVNPANQKGSVILLSKTKDLAIWIISGKAALTSGDKPKFKSCAAATRSSASAGLPALRAGWML
jgi:hypothetical protein